jgi:putative ABC transport system permease protein
MEILLKDIKYGVRMLMKSPAFTIVAVLTLALGVGANTAIFTLINAVMLKMLPIRDVQRLVVIGDPSRVHSVSQGTPQLELFSYPLYRDLRDGSGKLFTGMFAAGDVRRMNVAIETNGPKNGTEKANGRLVTGNYFPVLGVETALGRTITPEDDQTPGGHPVAVISYGYWQRRFAKDPNVLGKTIRVNDYPFSVIGVAAPGFTGEVIGESKDIWLPMMMQSQVMPGREWLQTYNVSWLQIMARLRPGVSVQQAEAGINVLCKQLLDGTFGARISKDDLEALRKNSKIEVSSGERGLSSVRRSFSEPLTILMGMVGLILLIACVNVANLLLARASNRQREIAIRLATGATAQRLVRQLLTESILLAFLGGICGLVFAAWGSRVLLKLASGAFSALAIDVSPDLRIFAFTAAICLLTGILFGLAPALRSLKIKIAPTIKDTTQASSGFSVPGSRWGIGKILIAVQMALSVLVLFAAGLLVRSLQNLKNLNMGYSREHVLIVNVDPVAAGYKPTQIPGALEDLRDRLSTLPGIRAVTFSENGLFSGTESADTIKVEGYTATNDDDKLSYFDHVGPGYFTAVGIPLRLGRDIGRQDTESSPKVAVINETMANFYFHGVNPMGRKIWIDNEEHRNQPPYEVIGVAHDAKDHSLRDKVERRAYFPLAQSVDPVTIANFEIRTIADPGAIGDSVRNQIHSFNPNMPVQQARTLDELVDSSLVAESIVAKLSSFFGLLALLLSCIGLYGVMSYTVAGRTREIGVRIALGAGQPSVLWMVLREALLLLLLGLFIGVPAALASGRLLSSMLFGLTSADPLSIVLVVLVLAAVACLAGFIPARRAAKVNPVIALRYE